MQLTVLDKIHSLTSHTRGCLTHSLPGVSTPPPDLQIAPDCTSRSAWPFLYSRCVSWQVSCKDLTTSLPPHRRNECAMSVSLPHLSPLLDYTVCLSLFKPRCFFVEKKDTTLRPCTDLCGLNKVTVENKYPLPLLSFVFELLQRTTIFSELYHCKAYHLLRIREGARGRRPSTSILTLHPRLHHPTTVLCGRIPLVGNRVSNSRFRSWNWSLGCLNVPTSVWAKVQTGDKDVRMFLPALRTSPPVLVLQVYQGPRLHLGVPGHTSPLTSSLACLSQEVKQSF